MLQLGATLPPGALIGAEALALAEALQATGGAWFGASADDMVGGDGAVTGWRDRTGTLTALATDQNTANSRFAPGPPGAVLCEQGQHCGFCLADFAPDVVRFSAAVIYSSPLNDARTLVSVSTGQANNLIFLGETEGHLSLKDRQSTAEVGLPIPPGLARPRLAVISFKTGGLHLRFAGRTVSADGRIPDMDHPGSLFIGCRSNRPGLLKTLGTSRLHDVLFWPDRAVLRSSDLADVAVLAALDRYHRWTY